MLSLRLDTHPPAAGSDEAPGSAAGPLNILCLGAHADDIEIGAAGTLMTLVAQRPGCRVDWVVATAADFRAEEAGRSAAALLAGLAEVDVHLLGLRESYLDNSGPAVKEALESVRAALPAQPDLVLTHHRDDRHQDHRAISDLTWSLWRDHLILEYEVPKWDGDLSRPNAYVPLADAVVKRKLAHLDTHFASQRSKDWFDAETFGGLMRLRGLECRSPSRYAEAFHARKLVLTP